MSLLETAMDGRKAVARGGLFDCSHLTKEGAIMALFRQKVNPYEFFYSLFRKVIETPELFPTYDALLEQDEFTKSELKCIHAEIKKLAIIYIRIYVFELSESGKITANKELCELGYGQAFLSVFQDDSIDFDSADIDPNNFLNTIDQYTVYLVDHSEESRYDDYFLAFQHFEDVVFTKRKSTETPVAAVTLAKYVRENVSKRLVNDLLRNYKVV